MAPKAGHAIGSTTIGGAGGAGVGGGVGVALADVLVELVPRLEPVELSLGILFAAALAYLGGILGGKFSPSSEKDHGSGGESSPPSPQPDLVVVEPGEDPELVELEHEEPGSGEVLPVPEGEDRSAA